jgi:hypothetical protein
LSTIAFFPTNLSSSATSQMASSAMKLVVLPNSPFENAVAISGFVMF